jgi:hypothetical protein
MKSSKYGRGFPNSNKSVLGTEKSLGSGGGSWIGGIQVVSPPPNIVKAIIIRSLLINACIFDPYKL